MLLLAIAIVAATWAGGWSGVPLVAFLWGAWRREDRGSPFVAGIAATLGWGLLLGFAALGAPVLAVARQLGGLAGVPGAVVVGVALLFVFALAWSAAEVGRTLMMLTVRRHGADED